MVCDYLAAGDGAGSFVRSALGVEMEGPGVLTHAVSILFEADLRSVLKSDPAPNYIIFAIQSLPAPSSPATTDVFGQLNVEYDPKTQSPQDFDS